MASGSCCSRWCWWHPYRLPRRRGAAPGPSAPTSDSAWCPPREEEARWWRWDGSSLYSVLNTVNFQINFSRGAETTPYATAGAGFALFGFGGYSETHALLGLGLGIRRRISEDHGSVRSEFRFDRLAGSSRGAALNSFAVKIGIDLWIR